MTTEAAQQLPRFENQVALVTGASRGIGAAIAKKLAKRGVTILLNYHSNKEAAERMLAEIKAHSPRSELLPFNVAESAEVESALQEALKRFEAIPILVCNAGISREALIPRASPEHFEEVLKTNFLGAVHPVRVLSRSMMRGRYGRIVLVSSVVGEMGNRGQAAYSASKSALFGFSKSVALELASRNVTCNIVCPGFIETEMTQSLDAETQQFYLSRIPVGRYGTIDDVASAVEFLVSPESGYITGATLDVNGGLIMR